jgi:site-specific DNA-methyltransferase (cytosine-N4-specific)
MSSSSRLTTEPVGYKLQAFERWLSDREQMAVSRGARRKHLAFSARADGVPTHQFFFDRFHKLVGGDSESLLDYAAQLRDGNRVAAHNYLTHGLHSYKGKFFPQIVRALLNVALVKPGDRVIDPFVGSGTTALESALMGFSARGIDRNPLAALIARTKVDALRLDASDVREATTALLRTLGAAREAELPNRDYLDRWFPAETLAVIARILGCVDAAAAPEAFKDLARLVLSTDLRAWSLQEPSQLRIFRRETAPPASELEERFRSQLRSSAQSLATGIDLIKHLGISLPTVRIECGDSRTHETWGADERFDALVTSPPYATALPYIDTDRLSIFALGLHDVGSRSALEWSMIGNREIRTKQRRDLEEALVSNSEVLPEATVEAILKIKSANDAAGVGFRRENLPALLYRYFADMKSVFTQARGRLKPRALTGVVIGDSYTVAGTERVRIETANHLAEVAAALGFDLEERVPMGGQSGYLPHQ